MAELFDILTYDYQKEKDILDIPDTWTQVVQLVTPSRPAGVYEIGFSVTYNLNATSTSVLWRWSSDGGVVWTEFTIEPKDSTDDMPLLYLYPINWDGGALDFQVEASKESALNILNIHFADLWFKRQG